MENENNENKIERYGLRFPTLFRDKSYIPQFFREQNRLMQNMLDSFGFPDFFEDEEWPSIVENKYRTALTDWKTEDKKYTGTVELPGIKKEEIKLNAIKGGLEILAEHYEKKEDKEGKSESRRNFRTYQRLPVDADIEHIEASYDNGILKLNVPRLEKPKSEGGIEIKVK